MALGTANNRLNTGNQLVLVERLGHIVISTEAETAHLILNTGKAGKNEDRRLHL